MFYKTTTVISLILLGVIIGLAIGLAIQINDPALKTAGAQKYIGEAKGFIGPVRLEVLVDNGEIVKINILEHNETPGVSDPAFEQIPTRIIENQGTDGVDVVTNATFTSKAIIEAVNNALTGVL